MADFYSDASFVTATFDSWTNFFSALFHSKTSFTGTTFYSFVDFSSANFDSSVDFFGAAFHFDSHFSNATFSSGVSFWRAAFHSKADFWKATFDSLAYFKETTFNSTANFSMATFESTADFSGASFGPSANFKAAKFQGNIWFFNATLPDSLDFRHVTDVAKEIDFTLSYPPRGGDKCKIALFGADISKIKLSMELFELWFPADTTIRTGDHPDTIISNISYDKRVSVYEQVLKKLKDEGLMQSYEILDIEYRQLKYRHKGGINWYVLNTFQYWWWNYGYNKERVFLWSIIFWLIFSFVNSRLYCELNENVYSITFLDKIQNNELSKVKRVIYYLLQVVTYTAIVFFGLKMDVAKFKKGVIRQHPWLFAYLMIVYIVGIVCLGFIVNIIFTL